MSRNNYDLYNNAQLARSIDAWHPWRRRMGAYAGPTGGGFINFGCGYSLAANGVVTQVTSKSTGVTMVPASAQTGLITTTADNLVAGTEVKFTVTCSAVTAADAVVVNHASGGTAGAYLVGVSAVGAGTFDITLSCVSGTDKAEAIVLAYSVVKAPFVRGAAIVGAGSVATSDTAAGSFVQLVTGSSGSGDSTGVITGTTLTRRDWNPWVRFSFATGTATQMGSTRVWIGAFSGDPSAVAGGDFGVGGALSGACFSLDTGVDGAFADGTSVWQCESGNAVDTLRTATAVPIWIQRLYTGEIRMNTQKATVDFYLAEHGPAITAGAVTAAARVDSPMRLVASHSIVPVAATPLYLGATVTTLAAAAKRLYFGGWELSQN
jgi:hypothetical protein